MNPDRTCKPEDPEVLSNDRVRPGVEGPFVFGLTLPSEESSMTVGGGVN